MPADSPEIRPLTGLRAPLAYLVVVYHFYRQHVPRAIPLLPTLVDRGFVAVGLFFVLSGFILTVVYAGRDLRSPLARREFFRARFARIYPVYALSLAVAFVAQLPGSARSLVTPKGMLHVALVLPLLNAVSHYGMFYLNWAAWSLSVEAVFYLAFPWLHAVVSRLSLRGLAILALLAFLVGLVAPTLYTLLDPDHLGRPFGEGDEVLWSWYLKFSPVTHVGAFLWGMVAGAVYVRHRARLFALMQAWGNGVALTATLLLVGALLSPWINRAFLYTDVLTPFYALLVLALALGGSFASRFLASAPLVTLGRASYATYILHVPLFYVFAAFVPDMWDSAAWFWPYLAALVAVSLVAHRFVEEPARRWLRGARG